VDRKQVGLSTTPSGTIEGISAFGDQSCIMVVAVTQVTTTHLLGIESLRLWDAIQTVQMSLATMVPTRIVRKYTRLQHAVTLIVRGPKDGY